MGECFFAGRGAKLRVLRAHFLLVNFKTLEREFKAQEGKNKQAVQKVSYLSQLRSLKQRSHREWGIACLAPYLAWFSLGTNAEEAKSWLNEGKWPFSLE